MKRKASFIFFRILYNQNVVSRRPINVRFLLLLHRTVLSMHIHKHGSDGEQI